MTSMQALLSALDGWLLRTTLGGGVVLLTGALWMLISRQPVKRQRIGELALLCALLVALPAALPAWWSLPGSIKSEPASPPATAKEEIKESEDDLTFNEELADPNSFEMLQMLGVLDDRNELVPIDAPVTEDALQMPPPEEKDHSALGVGLLSSGDSPWFRWMLRSFGIVYIGFVLFLLIRTAVGYYGLWCYWRGRRPAPAHVHTALAELEPDEQRRPRIGVCPWVHGPVSYGLWKPTILLSPAFCNEGDPEKLRWILAHELTHLRRRDAWGCLLLALGGAVYFHLPWFWWLKRQVRLAQEYVADAAAAKIASAVEYAQYLVSLTALTTRPSLASGRAAGVFETQSDLYRRVHMLLRQRNVVEGGAPRWWTLSAAASFLALAACTAGVRVNADEPEKTVTATVVVVDDDEKADKKKDKKTSVEFKVDSKDGKVQVWKMKDGKFVPVSPDDKDVKVHFDFKPGEGYKFKHGEGFKQGEGAFKWQPGGKIDGGSFVVGGKDGAKWTYVMQGDQKQKIEDALKKIDRVLSKLDKEEQPEARKALEDVKALLKKLQSSQGGVQMWTPDGRGAQKQGDEARKATDEARAKVQVELQRARAAEQAARVDRDRGEAQAQAAEQRARQAAERALARWRDSKDGQDRESAIKELEKAIKDRESQLNKLKGDMKKDAQPKKSGGDPAADRAEAQMKRLQEAERERTTAQRRAADALRKMQDEKPKAGSGKPRLGVTLSEVEDDAREEAKIPEGVGIAITDVVDPSPAWNNGKGLRSGDILVEFGGKKVSTDPNDFVKQVAGMKEGSYNAVVYRKGKKTTVSGIKLPGKEDKPSRTKTEDDDVAVIRGNLIEGDVILKLEGELAKLDRLKGDAIVKLSDVSKQLKDRKGELAIELDGVKKNLDGLVTLKLADALKGEDVQKALTVVRPENLQKHIDGLVTLSLDDARHTLKVQPEIVKDALKLTVRPEIVQEGAHHLTVRPEIAKGALTLTARPEIAKDAAHHLTVRPEIAKGALTLTARPELKDVKTEVKRVPVRVNVVDEQGGKPRLGVKLGAVPETVAAQLDLADDRGVFVEEVTGGSPAEKAGFQKNDIIIEFANKPVARRADDFIKALSSLKPGKYTATVMRKGKEVRIRNIELAEATKGDKKDWMVDDEKEKVAKPKEDAKKAKPKAKAKDEDEFARPRFGGFPNAGGNRNNTISVNNNEFTAKSVIDGDKTITVTGRIESGKATPRSITIKTGDEEKKYKNLTDVPEDDREDVAKLLKNIRVGGGVMRFGPGDGFKFDGNFGPEFEAQMKQLEEQMKKMREQMGRGLGRGGNFDQFEKQLEEMRKQIRELNKNRDKDDDQK
jgi:C-terminal processing protease CtpA/Prc